MATYYIGEIKIFACNFAPKNWAQCNGQLLAIAQNQALFSILGTTYGGNGTNNFALPNMQGRVPVHVGTNFPLGAAGGTLNETLLVTQIPLHNHLLNAIGGMSGQRSLSGNLLGSPTFNMYGPSPVGALNAGAIAGAGNNNPHSNVQPYQVQLICICISGAFPSRN